MRTRALRTLGIAALMVAAIVPATEAARPVPPSGGGRYIVLLRPGAERPREVARTVGLRPTRVDFVYRHAVHGYAATLTGRMVAALRRDPRVLSVTPDVRIRLAADRGRAGEGVVTENDAPWGLDRIDQRSGRLDQIYRFRSTGAGVTAYVVDTGIMRADPEFGGRAVFGVNTALSQTPNWQQDDCNGHGSHVAGIIGGETYGVAKDVRLVSVQVLGCAKSGTLSMVIAGLDWLVADHEAGTPAVANLSIEAPSSDATAPLDAAIQAVIDDGVIVVVAAGNGSPSGVDACTVTPANIPAVITVGATNQDDVLAGFSNHGPCVDINAPGVDIPSVDNYAPGTPRLLSGTSQASPHVAGVVARYLTQHPRATPAKVRRVLVEQATRGRISGLESAPRSSTPNRLLFQPAGD